MRKIISILLALGMVLSLSVMATPVAAAVTAASVTLSSYCACAAANYTITFNTTASLTEGVHSICIEFPAGTTVPATFATGAINVTGGNVFGTEVTVTGTKVCFLVPSDILAGPVTVIFKDAAGIKNPCTTGATSLKVNTTRAPDSTQVASATYTIKPVISTYGFAWDSNPTYPGIAVDFVPPFKACGQNTSGTDMLGSVYDATLGGGQGGFYNAFNLTLKPTTVGCSDPCTTNVTVNVTLTAAPSATAKVSLNMTGVVLVLNSTQASHVVDTSYNLTANTTWASLIHFDTVGSYQICFDAICPAGTESCANNCSAAASSVAHRCFDFKVYQWKDAAKITLREKWNLISLPLVPLLAQPIADQLASIPATDRAKIIAIHNYDRCADAWKVWGNGQSSLTTLVDGKAYWMRLEYPLTGCGNITWWVWGTPKPMPPAAPAAYPVCAGWNMVGYLSLINQFPSAYLWNWNAAPYPVVYGWDQGCWNVQNWNLITWGAENLVPGQGYWVAFPAAGAVYVP